jgi:regulatory protein
MENTHSKSSLSPEETVREYCLRALGRRLHSRRELELKLARKGHRGPHVSLVLDRFTEVGLINDESFARAYVASRQSRRPRGARALSMELAARGVARETIKQVLDSDLEDPLEAALRALKPRVRSLQALPGDKGWNRGMGFLQRRGFDMSVAKSALERLLKDLEYPE